MDGPYGLIIGSLEPHYPVVLFCITYHLGVFVSHFLVFFMNGVVKDVALDESVHLACEFADFLAFKFQVSHPPSFHEQGGCGYGHVLVYDSVE